MGIWEKMSDAFLEALGEEFGFAPPREHGLDTVQTIQAMHEGRVKVFVALGGNFLSAAPGHGLHRRGAGALPAHACRSRRSSTAATSSPASRR